MPQGMKLPILIASFLLLMLLERIFPLRQSTQAWHRRFLVNVALGSLLLLTVYLIARPSNLHLLQWGTTQPFGLSHLVPNSYATQSVFTFLMLDLSYYYWHRLSHRWPFLWRFHNIHHIDLDLDVSTSLRFHFMEIIFTIAFRLLQIIVIGVSLPVYLAYEFYFQLATYFHHSNLRLPKRFERLLNLLIITPRLHGIHHSNIQDEMDRNYGVIFSIWDRLHRSYRNDIHQNQLSIGVAAYQTPADNRLLRLIRLPFAKQKNPFLRGDERFYTRAK